VRSFERCIEKCMRKTIVNIMNVASSHKGINSSSSEDINIELQYKNGENEQIDLHIEVNNLQTEDGVIKKKRRSSSKKSDDNHNQSLKIKKGKNKVIHNIITNDNVRNFLGSPIYSLFDAAQSPRIGITNGLAYTNFGGEMLEIEAVVMPGTGVIHATGKLGETMRESITTAISYIRSQSNKFMIDDSFFPKHDIHLHAPESAIAKDGPSAGVTICTSILSVITQIPVYHNVAMTGEITLSGKILAIGGLKEKILAALRSNILTIIIPMQNHHELDELKDITKDMTIHMIDDISDLWGLALTCDPRTGLENSKHLCATIDHESKQQKIDDDSDDVTKAAIKKVKMPSIDYVISHT